MWTNVGAREMVQIPSFNVVLKNIWIFIFVDCDMEGRSEFEF